jgi:hypothetical protein
MVRDLMMPLMVSSELMFLQWHILTNWRKRQHSLANWLPVWMTGGWKMMGSKNLIYLNNVEAEVICALWIAKYCERIQPEVSSCLISSWTLQLKPHVMEKF